MSVGRHNKHGISGRAAKVPDVNNVIDGPRIFLSAQTGPGHGGLVSTSHRAAPSNSTGPGSLPAPLSQSHAARCVGRVSRALLATISALLAPPRLPAPPMP